ncbi:MAG: hypothetical protein JJ713_00040 [Acidithiobacillus sp.]|uniref:hypothetical protein n=1 Tax=Acidithiobacillus sp. TaxID=1872118 RepID=UPI00258375A6|nr:hypothetical protein [Acidithiobacillus sp.]MCE5419170.1 hypothetical protein [Acidithiobacillus sp.]
MLQATGFASGMTASNAVVKFEVQGTTTVTKGTGVSVAWNSSNSTYTITCTVPNSPTPNRLVTGIIKVKNTSTSEKASTPGYSISSAGVEMGFRWGFPDRIATNPVIGAGATTPVLGGGQLQISAPGLHVFKKTTGTVDYPTLFAKDTSSPPLKVRIKGSSLTNSGNLWSGTWTADGAPTVCTSGTPCIATNQALELDLINPDNSITDSSDYNYPSAKYVALKVAAANPVTFLPPSAALVFGPGAGYGPTNSVGYTTNASGQPGDLAIRPLQGATSHVTFHGQNLYRIKAITNDDGRSWLFSDPAHPTVIYVTGPTASDTGWGTTFTA